MSNTAHRPPSLIIPGKTESPPRPIASSADFDDAATTATTTTSSSITTSVTNRNRLQSHGAETNPLKTEEPFLLTSPVSSPSASPSHLHSHSESKSQSRSPSSSPSSDFPPDHPAFSTPQRYLPDSLAPRITLYSPDEDGIGNNPDNSLDTDDLSSPSLSSAPDTPSSPLPSPLSPMPVILHTPNFPSRPLRRRNVSESVPQQDQNQKQVQESSAKVPVASSTKQPSSMQNDPIIILSYAILGFGFCLILVALLLAFEYLSIPEHWISS